MVSGENFEQYIKKTVKNNINEILDNLDNTTNPEYILEDGYSKIYSYNYKDNIVDIKISYFPFLERLIINFKLNGTYVRIENLKNNVTINEILIFIFSNIKKIILEYKPKELSFSGEPKKIRLYTAILNKFNLNDYTINGDSLIYTIPDEFYKNNINEVFDKLDILNNLDDIEYKDNKNYGYVDFIYKGNKIIVYYDSIDLNENIYFEFAINDETYTTELKNKVKPLEILVYIFSIVKKIILKFKPKTITFSSEDYKYKIYRAVLNKYDINDIRTIGYDNGEIKYKAIIPDEFYQDNINELFDNLDTNDNDIYRSHIQNSEEWFNIRKWLKSNQITFKVFKLDNNTISIDYTINDYTDNKELKDGVTTIELLTFVFYYVKQILIYFKPSYLQISTANQKQHEFFIKIFKKFGLNDIDDAGGEFEVKIPATFYKEQKLLGTSNNINEMFDNLDTNDSDKYIEPINNNLDNTGEKRFNYNYKGNDIEINIDYAHIFSFLRVNFKINNSTSKIEELKNNVTPIEILKYIFGIIKKIILTYKPKKLNIVALKNKAKIYLALLKRFGIDNYHNEWGDNIYIFEIPDEFYKNNINEVFDNLDTDVEFEHKKEYENIYLSYKGNKIQISYDLVDSDLYFAFAINYETNKAELKNEVKAIEILVYIFSVIKKMVLQIKPKSISFKAEDYKLKVYRAILNKYGLTNIQEIDAEYKVEIPDEFYKNNINEVFDNLDNDEEYEIGKNEYEQSIELIYKGNPIRIKISYDLVDSDLHFIFFINNETYTSELKNKVKSFEILVYIFSVIKKIILEIKPKTITFSAEDYKYRIYLYILNKYGLNNIEEIKFDEYKVIIPDSFYQNNISETSVSENKNYFKGLSKSTSNKKKTQMKKQADMDDSNPSAYKTMPGDTKGKKLLKTSKHTTNYHKQFDEDYECLNESLSDKIKTALKKKSEKSGISLGVLSSVMRRGMAAWKSGHRPGASQEQWAYARVNSFITKGSGTWGGADKDLAKRVKKKKKKVNELFDNLDNNIEPENIETVSKLEKSYQFIYKDNEVTININSTKPEGGLLTVKFLINNSYENYNKLKNNVTPIEILIFIFSCIKKLILKYKPKDLGVQADSKKMNLYLKILKKYNITEYVTASGIYTFSIPDEFYQNNINEVLDNLNKNSKPQKINNDIFNFSKNPNINDTNKTYNYNYKGNVINIQIIYFSDTRTITIGFKINESYTKVEKLKNGVTTNEILIFIFSNIKKLFLTYKPKYLKYAGVTKKIMLYKIMLNKFGITDIENTGVDQNGEIVCKVTIPEDFYQNNISENYIPTKFSDYLSQGKSNSHIAASEDENKVTASVAAKFLSKKFNVKILAKDIIHLSNEWHHSGVFKGSNGKTKANKTYFFNKEDLNNITLEQINLKTNDEKIRLVKGWFMDWSSDRKPYIGIYEGPLNKAPKSFIELSKEQFELAKTRKGERIPGYTTPDFTRYKI